MEDQAHINKKGNTGDARFGDVVSEANSGIAKIFFIENYVEALTQGYDHMPLSSDSFWANPDKMKEAAINYGLPDNLLERPSDNIVYSHLKFTDSYLDTDFKVVRKVNFEAEPEPMESFFVFDKNWSFQREIVGKIAKTINEESGLPVNLSKKQILPIIGDKSLIIYDKKGDIIFEKSAEKIGIDYDNTGTFKVRRINDDNEICVYDSESSEQVNYNYMLQKATLEYPRSKQEGYLVCYDKNGNFVCALSSGDLADLTFIYKSRYKI